MVFKPKFFLDLGGGDGQSKPAVVAPVKEKAARPAKAAKGAKAVEPTAAAAPAAAEAAAPAPSSSTLTTAEAIAAELAAAQASRPAPKVATFAPDCLTPGGAAPRRRRYAGANLAPFKEMAKGMMRG